ncbi:MAG: outer membrane lipoprotein carrier protein LolA [Cytophagales bacterium]|nr:outer membrane lipoprotein carrier protein LolA [Bernardetiaceae bacterium]MDW8210348.1 outer membrane lipoprotein carrier protein LolA [Cytophagales bacterium]
MKPFAILVNVFLINIYAASSQIYKRDPKAEAILNAMSERYKKMSAFRAEFSYHLRNPQEKLDETFNGVITVKGAKFRLQLGNQEIYNNQTTVWTYSKEDNEVTITEYDPESGDINPAEVYNMYKKGFKYYYMEEKRENNETYDVIDLIPENKDLNYFKIRLTINKKTHDLKSWQIFEKNGRRSLYVITKFQPDIVVADAFFNFDKSQYPKVVEVDLR